MTENQNAVAIYRNGAIAGYAPRLDAQTVALLTAKARKLEDFGLYGPRAAEHAEITQTLRDQGIEI